MTHKAGMRGADGGYAMAALLVGMSVMAVALSVALPVWNTLARREREAELIFRGEQYSRAIGLFQRKYGNALPPNLDVLLNERFLRRKYTDPVTGGEFQLLSGAASPVPPGGATPPGRPAGAGPLGIPTPAGSRGGAPAGTAAAAPGGIMGVASRSTEKSLRLYYGRGAYNEWTFVAVQRDTAAGGVGTPAPGIGGRGSTAPGVGRGRGVTRPGGAGGSRGTGSLSPPPFGTPRGGSPRIPD